MDEIPLVTPHWNFDLAASTCGSTAAGAIYLNRSDRFQGGTVSLDEVPRLIEQITDWVETFLQRELGCRPRTLRTQDKNVRCPDIVVLAEGVEFHNSSTHVAVDTSNKPSLTHGGPGFAWLQSRAISGNKLTSLELHKILVGARNA